MKKSLLALLIISAFVSCKKDDNLTNTTPIQSSGKKYVIKEIADVSALLMYTVHGEIYAPNHPSAHSDQMVNFEEYLKEEVEPELDGQSIAFGSNGMATLGTTGHETQEVPFEQIGNYYILDGYLPLEMIGQNLILRNFDFDIVEEYTDSNGVMVYQSRGGGDVYSGELKDAVVANLSEGDTASVRSYNIVFSAD